MDGSDIGAVLGMLVGGIFVLAILAGVFIGCASIFSSGFRAVLLSTFGCYAMALILSTVMSGLKSRSFLVGAGVLLLIPAHHLGIGYGIVKGVLQGINVIKREDE